MIYKCPRCHYLTEYKGNYKKHLKRLNVCKPVHSDIPINTVLYDFETYNNQHKVGTVPRIEYIKNLEKENEDIKYTNRELIKRLNEQKNNIIILLDQDEKYNPTNLQSVTKNISNRQATLILIHNHEKTHLEYITSSFLDNLNSNADNAVSKLVDFMDPPHVI